MDTQHSAAARTAEQKAADRARLLELIDTLAVVRGKVTLSSGKEADYYVDLRRITLHHEAAPLVGRVMLDVLEDAGVLGEVEAAGGLTLGADPVATAMMHAASTRSGAPALDAFVVRKANKAHGLQRRIEGPSIEGRPVVAVEDTSTTGGSVLTACEAITEDGADIRAVAVIMHREAAAQQAIEAAGHRYLYAFSVDELNL